jgi:hypothetical protein
VAHGLLQCGEEVRLHLAGLASDLIWVRPGGAASVGFHVRHAGGSLDRLFTYARGESLTGAQMAELRAELEPDQDADAAARLITGFDRRIEQALAQLRRTSEAELLAARAVGRARLPSTVLGLLFHAAEHTQRHIGQMVTTATVVRGGAIATGT